MFKWKYKKYGLKIIDWLKSVSTGPEGISIDKMLLCASGLAGYACRQAVKANREPVMVVATKNNKNFYMGDAVNRYVLEDKYSVLSACNAFFENYAKVGEDIPDVTEIVKKAVLGIGDESYRLWGLYEPANIYCSVRKYWNEIYGEMIAPCCKKAEEMPVLFASVLQNIMAISSQAAPARELYCDALECVIFISKMDDDSI